MKPRIGAVPARYRRNRFRLAVVAAFAAVPAATLMAVQKPQQPTSPFEVQSAFTGSPAQDGVQVAVDADGDAVVVFDGVGTYDGDGDAGAVRVMKIDAHGRFVAPGGALDPTGKPRLVNTTTSGDQRHAAIAMDRDGDFVVAWQGGPYDFGQDDIFLQRFDRDFQPVGSEVQVTSHASGQSLGEPAVAMDADGDFVIVWSDNLSDYGVRGRRFLADGTSDGAPFNVSSQTGYSRGAPRVAMDAKGDFAVAWHSYSQDGSQYGVYARAFAADGTPRAGEFRVNAVTTYSQSSPDIAMDVDGDFVIAWNDIDGQYTATVHFQRYDATGAAVGGNGNATDTFVGSERLPSVGMAASGDFVIAWTGPEPNESDGVLARRFAADGTALAKPFSVNATTVGSQDGVDVALDADGDIAIGYSSYYYYGGGAARFTRPTAIAAAAASGTSMLFRRFTGGEAVDLVVRERAASIADVPADTPYTLDFTIRNRHATPALEGIGTATGLSVDLVSDQGAFNGIVQKGWACGTASFCAAAGFCLTCLSDEPIPAGGQTRLTVRLQAPPDSGIATTSVAGDLNQYDPRARNNALSLDRTVVPQDNAPDPFDFPNQGKVPVGSVRTSDPVVIAGINVPTPITVLDGLYSKNGGPFTSAQGTVVAGDRIVARHRAADTFSTATITRVTVGALPPAVAAAGNGATTNAVVIPGPQTGRFRSTTEAADDVPDAFSFPPVVDSERSALQVSDPVTVTGINLKSAISIVDGLYSVNGRAFTATQGSVGEGDVVRVRRRASPDAETTVTATLTIGGVSGSFAVTTQPPDLSPDPFAFSSQDGVPVGSVRVSNAIAVAGIDAPTAISVDKGRYRVNGGSFTSDAGTVVAGDSVIVQQTAADAPSTAKTTTLTIGDRAGTFTTTTTAPDDHPNAFAFSAQSGVPLDSLRTSNAIVVGGINVAVDIVIAGGTYSVNNLPYSKAAGTVKSGDIVRVRHTSASTPATAVTTMLTIGDVAGTFRSTTVAADAVPDAFALVDQVGATPNANVDSNTIVVSGINVGVPVSVTGGKYRINGGTWRSGAGTVGNGDQVQVRVQASATPGARRDAVLTIGGVSDTFSVTTAP